MPTIGTKVPDRWVPTHVDGDRALYLDIMRGTWYFAEFGIIRGVYPDTHSGRNVVTIALIKGLDGAAEVLAGQLERKAA